MIFKGISHVHSTCSFDGTLSLVELKDALSRAGYAFALMSEHVEGLSTERWAGFLDECRRLSDDGFLFVPGLEFHGECISVNGLTTALDMTAPRQHLLRRALGDDTFNVLVHPALAPFDRLGSVVDRVHAVEVWNCKYDGARFPSAEGLAIWRRLRGSGRRSAIFGIDLHRRSQLVPVYLEIDSEELSIAAVLRALHAGRYSLHHGDARIDPAALPAGSMLAICGYGWLRRVAAEPYRRVKPYMPSSFTRRIRALLNGWADAA